jgi:hypothetical protein
VAGSELRGTALAEARKLAGLSRSAYGKTKLALRERTIAYVRETLVSDMLRLTPPE